MRNVAGIAALSWVLATALPCAQSGQTSFSFSLEKNATTSAGVYTADGRMVRTLWSLKKLDGGAHQEQWDGLDDFGRNLPPADYQIRIACGNVSFNSVGTVGNSGVGRPMQAGTDDLITDRKTGDIYTANNWEEAGQDFRKMDAAGKQLTDARFGVRNGTPNGWPIAVAIEPGILYCSVFTIHEPADPGSHVGRGKTLDGGAVIRKFDSNNGNPLKFPTPTGYIRVREPDLKDAQPMEHQSLHSITLCGDAIVAADRRLGKIYEFDKNTGKAIGGFAINEPVCVICDDAKRLWIAHDHDKVTVMDLQGKAVAEPEVAAKDIACIRLAPEKRLWVADQDSGQILVYQIGASDKLTPLKSYGHKAQPGEFGALAIGHIQSFDVMPDGGFVLAQTYGHGSVVTRFSSEGNVIWQQVGLEFCTNGTCDPKQPDLFISSLSNAYRLLDRDKGTWRFEGTMYQGPMKLEQSTGTPRIIDRDGRRYYYSLTGDQVKVFRMEGSRMVASVLVGLTQRAWDEKLLGPEKDKPTHYTWHDANGDGQIQADEITRVDDNKSQIASFSCEVDGQGNLIIPNHFNNAIDVLPLEKFDDHGNPVYDLSKLRQLLPPDDTLQGLRPQKACPLPDGGMYVLQAADPAFYAPSDKDTGFGKPAGVCWMGGWVYSKYDKNGRRLFTIPLPNVCTGMDWVPNVGRTQEMGVVVGVYSALQLCHYSPDGLLLEYLSPKHTTGWLDHNGSISITRNSTDGLADLFAEESLSNRISWYRMDDRDVKTVKVAIHKQPSEGEKYSSEEQFNDLLHSARDKIKAGQAGPAIETFEKALQLATDREKPFVQYELGQACERNKELDQAIAHFQGVVDAPGYDVIQKAELLLRISQLQRQQKRPADAIASLNRLMQLPAPEDRHYVPRALAEIGNIDEADGKPEEALQQFHKAQEYLKTTKSPDPNLYHQTMMWAGEVLQREKKYPEALKEYEQSLNIADLDDNGHVQCEAYIARCYEAMNDPAQAAEHFAAGFEKYPAADPGIRADLLLSAAEMDVRAGDRQAAERIYQQVLTLDQVSADRKKAATERLAQLKK